jgi:hypothetical protein
VIYRGVRTGFLRRGILKDTLKLSDGKLALKIKPLEIIGEKKETKKKKDRSPEI